MEWGVWMVYPVQSSLPVNIHLVICWSRGAVQVTWEIYNVRALYLYSIIVWNAIVMSIDPSHIRALIRKAIADHSYYVSTRTTLPSSELDSYTNQKRDRALDDVVATLQAQYDEQWRELEKVSIVSATSIVRIITQHFPKTLNRGTLAYALALAAKPVKEAAGSRHVVTTNTGLADFRICICKIWNMASINPKLDDISTFTETSHPEDRGTAVTKRNRTAENGHESTSIFLPCVLYIAFIKTALLSYPCIINPQKPPEWRRSIPRSSDCSSNIKYLTRSLSIAKLYRLLKERWKRPRQPS